MNIIDFHKHSFQFLESLITDAIGQKQYENTIVLSKILARFATIHYSGTLYSKIAEESLNTIAGLIEDQDIRKQQVQRDTSAPRKILHVLTAASGGGGHTRLAKNWILNASSEEEHSLLLLTQEEAESPTWLREEVISRGGKIHSFKKIVGDMGKARELRRLSDSYDYIVLHISMEDPIGNLAFGYIGCKTKIIYLNHADHLFWLGISVVGAIAEIRTAGKEISILKRDSRKSFVLDIPLALPKDNTITIAQARDTLQIDPNDIILLSVGSSYKFKPDANVNFIKMALRLIEECPVNTKLIVIGPSMDEPQWKDANIKSGGKIIPLGYISKNLDLYQIACDVYLDCYPLSSLTAVLEPIMLGKKIVRLDYGPIENVDSLLNDEITAKTEDEYIEKVLYFIDHDLQSNLKESVMSIHTFKGWQEKLFTIYRFLENPMVSTMLDKVEDALVKEKKFESMIVKESLNRYFFLKKIKNELNELDRYYRYRIIFHFLMKSNFKNKIKTFFYWLFKWL